MFRAALLVSVSSLATRGAHPALSNERAPLDLTGAWVVTLTLSDSSAALSGHAIVYLAFSDSVHTYLDAVATVGEHRTDLRPQFGWQPPCVSIRGPAEAFVDSLRVRVAIGNPGGDCGLTLNGVISSTDSVAGEWVRRMGYAGDRVAGMFVMVRAGLPLLPSPRPSSWTRGFGRGPGSPIRLGGGEAEGASRIEAFIRQLRDPLATDTVPSYRRVALCCAPPAPFDAPIDVYEVRWERNSWQTPPDSQVRVVALDTLYFARFPLPTRPDGYNGLPLSLFVEWQPN